MHDARRRAFLVRVPRGRLELPRITPPAPKAGASANSATSACHKEFII